MGRQLLRDNSNMSKENLVHSYVNRNKANSNVMGALASPSSDELKKGLYKAAMNSGTSKVNND